MSPYYLLQITAVWLTCYLFYLLWLKKEKLPLANRLFLLGSLAAGLLIPLLPALSWWEGGNATGLLGDLAVRLETITVIAYGQAPVTTPDNAFPWLTLGWLAGSLIALSRLLAGWRQLYRLAECRPGVVLPTGSRLVFLPAGASPFSYGSWLFWPENLDRHEPEWQAVWAHEQAHIRQGHTYDLLFIDLLTVVFWWNPLPYVYRRDLRLQHEYLADAAATQTQASSRRDYARLLLQHQLVGRVPRPGQAFHHSHIKNRILMLTQPQGARWKLLAILPLLLVLLWACNEEADLTGVNISETEEQLAQERSNNPDGDFTTETYTINQDGASKQVTEKVYKVVEQMPIYGDCSAELATGDIEEAVNCGNTKLLTDIYSSVKYPAVARERGVEGMVVMSFVVPATGGQAQDLQIVRSAAVKGLMKKSKDGATVTAYDQETPLQTATEKEATDALDQAALAAARTLPQDWIPGMQDGKPVAVRFTLPIKFKLE